jgi:hypothetical protein
MPPEPILSQLYLTTGVGACAALQADDLVTCTYRGHGAALAVVERSEIA